MSNHTLRRQRDRLIHERIQLAKLVVALVEQLGGEVLLPWAVLEHVTGQVVLEATDTPGMMRLRVQAPGPPTNGTTGS